MCSHTPSTRCATKTTRRRSKTSRVNSVINTRRPSAATRSRLPLATTRSKHARTRGRNFLAYSTSDCRVALRGCPYDRSVVVQVSLAADSKLVFVAGSQSAVGGEGHLPHAAGETIRGEEEANGFAV